MEMMGIMKDGHGYEQCMEGLNLNLNHELEFREAFVDVLFRVECCVHGVHSYSTYSILSSYLHIYTKPKGIFVNRPSICPN